MCSIRHAFGEHHAARHVLDLAQISNPSPVLSDDFVSLVIAAGVAFGIFNNPEKKDGF